MPGGRSRGAEVKYIEAYPDSKMGDVIDEEYDDACYRIERSEHVGACFQCGNASRFYNNTGGFYVCSEECLLAYQLQAIDRIITENEKGLSG